MATPQEGYKDGVFRTRNMALAATLLAMGYPIERVEAFGATALRLFVFNDTDETKSIIERFWKGELLLEPQNILSAYDDVKSQMRERAIPNTSN